ncbi:MAG TPA: sensor histidine kinase [Actinomycetota bacterium]|nr:sensor histidine kinase [Actinomycetota bacterium]
MPNALVAGSHESLPRHRIGPLPPWAWYVVAGSAASLIYLAIPSSIPLPALVPRLLLYQGVSASAVVALVIGVRRHRPGNLWPWYLLIAGQVVSLLADLTFYTLHGLLHSEAFPSPADLLYLGRYPFVVIAVLQLARSRGRGSDRASFIDASIIAIGVGMLSLVFLIEPTVAATEQPLLMRSAAAAYSIMDMLVLAVAARLAVGAGLRRPAFYLLTSSLVVLLATDTGYIYLQLEGLYQTDSVAGRLLDAGWLTYYLLLGASALHPSMRTLSERDLRSHSRLGRGRLTFLASAALLTPAAIVLESFRGEQHGTAVLPLACALLFLLVIYRMSGLIRQVETSAAELRERGAALETALSSLEKVETERKHLLDRTMRGAEEERSRIATELHDGPIQRLTAVGYQLEEASLTLSAGNPAYVDELLNSAQRNLYGEINELRGLMATLRPPVLDELGLGLALADQLDAFERRTGIMCFLDTDRQVRLEPEIETVLYRVAQEALINVAKHSRAYHVWVYLRTDDERADMQVRDDGIGFDPNSVNGLTGRGHFGLAGMRERVEMAGGRYRLLSSPGGGTAIRVRLPRRKALPPSRPSLVDR